MGGRTFHTIRAVSGGPKANSPTYLGEEVWDDDGFGGWLHEFSHLAHYAMEKSTDSPSKRLATDVKAVYKRACMQNQAPNQYSRENHHEFFAEVMRIYVRGDHLSQEISMIAVAVISRSQLPATLKETIMNLT